MESTLCLLRKENQLLLAKKKKGFGKGKYNGVGGKLEKDETPEMAMIREVEEEIFVTPLQYEKVGVIEFLEYLKDKREKVLIHLYVCNLWEGVPSESEEMEPKWFSIDKLPYDQMFLDDRYWLPLILEGKKIKAFFEFDEEWNLVFHEVQEVSDETVCETFLQ